MSNRENIKRYSPNEEAWRRFKKNKPAVFGLGLVLLAGLIALLGYAISPDQSPKANEQIPPLALKAPGHKATLLAVRKNKKIKRKSFFNKMLFGQENPYKHIPINNFEIKEDKLIYEAYEGEDYKTGKILKGKQKEVLLADVLYPLSFREKNINSKTAI